MGQEAYNGHLEALKVSMRPMKLDIEVECGERLIVWARPWSASFSQEAARRKAIQAQLKTSLGLEGSDLDLAVAEELVCEGLVERLVKPPKDADKGFVHEEIAEPLFERPDQVLEYLSYNARNKIRLEIQKKALNFVPEIALKN